ncbi:GntR family transcriptional regulator [Chelativorans sp. AA-79]|uniref:GntR family transcriptional regulator n=1 Tax=Chelativorans sp. AA-79 TaxID=3028735 RepID=UPI0023F90A6D|nr:GntR family transcriptional regulator [Chelativorans sp. AA-79]WEX09736.1 GntR family transcriptional regulator [Chelativorans sp. AA-79]
MIVTLELAPGAITTEGALIDGLGLGRTPVREAIQRLAWEGLVEVRPRAGLAIAPLNRADWVKIIDARHGVEILLARAAARYASGPLVTQFHEAALRMEKAVLEGSPLHFLDADRLLDEVLGETADNPYAARLAGPLQTHSRRFWFRYQSENDLAHAAEQHVRLIRAILDRNEEDAGGEADALMRLLRKRAESVARF